MLSKNQTKKFISRVLEQTHSGKLTWSYDQDKQEFQLEEEPVGYPMSTQLGGEYLRITQIRYKYWTDEGEWEWDGRIVLDFVTDGGKLLWRFPPSPEIAELYERVRFSTSGVEGAIQKFLEDDNDEE